MTPQLLLTAVGSVLGIAMVLGVAYAVLRSTLSRTTSELWKEEADALRVRLATVEQAEEACQTRLALVEQANKVLADTVSGATAVALLSQQMDRRFADVLALLDGGRHSDKAS